MITLFARFPVLADVHVLAFAVAVALAVVSFVITGDAATARPVIFGNR